MARCALIVEFRLVPGGWSRFIEIMGEHARLTRAEEPGCHQFDVLHADDDADRAILVEVYADRDAYEAHRANPRMPGVNEALAPLTVERNRTICTVA
jgi:quinol monooxygenase YgiN